MQQYSVRAEEESETLLARPVAVAKPEKQEKHEKPEKLEKQEEPSRRAAAEVAEPSKEPAPRAATVADRRRVLSERLRQIRKFPFVQLFGYYVVLSIVVTLLMAMIPSIRRSFVQPILLPALTNVPNAVEQTLALGVERGLTTLLVTLGALALVLPVAWVYTFTKRLRYDPSLVQSVIILPVVVTGILLVVKNSLALAFSLAGIVAAVRFRNTLKDPKDAVYIFLALGIGIASGVQALDVALVMSLIFNLMVLVLWKYNVGSIYTGWHGRSAMIWSSGPPEPGSSENQFISVGDPGLVIAQSPETRREIKKRLGQQVNGMQTDGILLVHSAEPETAREAVEDMLADMTKDWRLAEVSTGEAGHSTAEYLLRLRKRFSAVDLLGALDERWSSQVAAAEYIPFKNKKKK